LPRRTIAVLPEIHIDLATQTLRLSHGGVVRRYAVSTAANGPGERYGSGCTPRGRHRVRAKVGADCPVGAVFRARRWTGEVYTPELDAAQPGRDWILTRILWLTGTESGRNRGGMVDSLRRFIYIHGCPPTEPMGVPRSHGCIRMRDADLLALFDSVPVGTPVEIR
jgi:lipoprotein-anchoring transpeptidase ErfK/SrfK